MPTVSPIPGDAALPAAVRLERIEGEADCADALGGRITLERLKRTLGTLHDVGELIEWGHEGIVTRRTQKDTL